MYKGKKILAIIPARAGSQRLLNKNIKVFCGKPLIAWSIEQSIHSRYIDDCIVSTNNTDIATIAKRFNGKIPFLRPDNLSTSTSRIIDTIFYTLDYYCEQNCLFDLVILLQPTSPLRTTEDIDSAIEYLFTKKAKAVVSVCKTSHTPIWTNTLPDNMSMKDFIQNKYLNLNSQELPVFYNLNGAIYISEVEYLRNKKAFISSETFAFEMPVERSIDIDTDIDFLLGEILFKQYFS